MRVVFILSSHDRFGDTGRSTGTWLEELLRPYYYLTDQNAIVTIATPRGLRAPIDPLSLSAFEADPLYRRYLDDRKLQNLLAQTIELSQVVASDVDAVIFPGGHGPLWDLRHDPHAIRLIEECAGSGKPVATICHAGCVLLGARTPDGKPLVSGRPVTAFSDSEERVAGFDRDVPYVVEEELRSLGALYLKADDWQEHVVQDGCLISGQNPASALAVAKAVHRALSAP